ncbi:MAG: hypothetical protein SGBAC_003879 [Bacillariaceae sp.]
MIMKTPLLITAAALIGPSEAFSTVGPASRPSSALYDAAILDQITQGGDQMMIAAGGAAAVAAAAAAALFVNKNGGDGTAIAGKGVAAAPEAIDVSIPYNSAAMLAFSGTNLPKSKFEEYESLYLAKTVADVTAKKMARDVLEMEKIAAKLAKDMEALSAQ